MKTVTTFDYKSDQLTQADSEESPRLLDPQEKGGRIRFVKFSATAAASANETLELVRLERSATIISGAIVLADLGAGTVDIGTDDGTTADPDAIASALADAQAHVLPEAVGYTPISLSSGGVVYATFSAAAAGAISGYLLYVENS